MVILEVYLFGIAEELDEEMPSVMLVELFHVVLLLDKDHHHPTLLVIELCLIVYHESVIDFEECQVVN